MAKVKVVIVDYKLGNLYNLSRAINELNIPVEISHCPELICRADKLILPGVGAFPSGLRNMKELGLYDAIVDFKNSGKDILGICLGMQLLLDSAEENGFHHGFGFIPGQVRLLKKGEEPHKRCKIPQISWNTLMRTSANYGNPLLNLMPDPVYMYFIHSYGVYVSREQDAITHTSYGENIFCSVMAKDNIYGCQFHPEVSGEAGLLFLKNFINL